MNQAQTEASCLDLEVARLPLPRRAAFRRVLAVLKAQKRKFMIGGVLGISMHVNRLHEGDLDIFLREMDAPIATEALKAAGYKVEHDLDRGLSRVLAGDAMATLHWALPPPLGGSVDETWFERSQRVSFVDVRVRLAPIEELLWVRMATLDRRAALDPLVEEVLLRCGGRMDWNRLLGRMVGLEELLLGTIFLFDHRHHRSPGECVPIWVVPSLIGRMNMTASTSVEPASVSAGVH